MKPVMTVSDALNFVYGKIQLSEKWEKETEVKLEALVNKAIEEANAYLAGKSTLWKMFHPVREINEKRIKNACQYLYEVFEGPFLSGFEIPDKKLIETYTNEIEEYPKRLQDLNNLIRRLKILSADSHTLHVILSTEEINTATWFDD